ncbi:unnamed protein product [Ectocarpus sp. 4 AP-2014]
MPPQQPSATDGIPRTCEVPFSSSLHGRERRALRGITRIDLQSAVKYGKKDTASPNQATGARRWKYTHANIVYITDETSTLEITCYVKPNYVPRANLTPDHVRDYEIAKNRVKTDPSLCTSHTVIVVDQSGSMNMCDVTDFRTRSMAVFGTLALDFVGKQRLSGEATDRDAVSLVLMRDSAEIVFEREPMDLVLYNKFVGLHDQSRPRSHGMFLPALNEAERLLKSQVHGGCALSLMFLSNGRPSDQGSSPMHVIADRVRSLAEVFGQQLSVTTLGFGNKRQDFSVLEAMAGAAQDVGAQGEFHRPELTAEGLGTAIAGTISSLAHTREAAGSEWGHAPTALQTGDGWIVYKDDLQRYEFSNKGIRYSRFPWVRVDHFSPEATAIAIRKKALGEGSGRLVFGLQEVSLAGEFVGPKLVAKESKHVGDEYLKMEFQGSFAKTQQASKLLAAKFNAMVRERMNVLGLPTSRAWDVSFIGCSVYQFMDGPSVRGVLVEKMLEPACRYTKWNGNDGYVHCAFGSPTAARVTKMLKNMEAIMEGNDEEDGTDSVVTNDEDDDDSGPPDETAKANPRATSAITTPGKGEAQARERCQALETFMEVTLVDSRVTASHFLDATDWIPDAAISLFLESGDFEPAQEDEPEDHNSEEDATAARQEAASRAPGSAAAAPGGRSFGPEPPLPSSSLPVGQARATADRAWGTGCSRSFPTANASSLPASNSFGSSATPASTGAFRSSAPTTFRPGSKMSTAGVTALLPAPAASRTLGDGLGGSSACANNPPAAAGVSLGKRPPSARSDEGHVDCSARNRGPRGPRGMPSRSFAPKAECYPQAFSHFSYWQTRRRMLVCDLQGVLSSSAPGEDRAGVFELTDPIIHYRSKSGRTQVYGKTDLGKSGMNKFFETHRCNDVCRLLGFGE